jgi:magnesium transporter
MNNFPCQLYHYNDDSFLLTKNTTHYFAENFAKKELKNDKIHWLNFHTIDDRENLELLCLNLGIEKHSIDDIYENYKRSKLEEYPNYLFFTIKSALTDNQHQHLLYQENISFILGKNYLISFQEKSSDHFTDVRDRIEKKRGRIRVKGADFLLFRMLDSIIDNYFEVLEDIVSSIEKFEKVVIRNPQSSTLKNIEIQKRKLIELRKIVFPLKEVTSQLEKLNSSFLMKENFHYFSDLKDSCLTILDEIDANKQILDGMANLYFAVQGQKMNEVIKLLTIVSTIFIPLTFIVGVYGMNFENMPELPLKYGYFMVWGIMVLIVVAMILFFKRKGWLGK